MRKKGFTLLEVMIVVLVIVILLAIAIPNALRASASRRENALRSDLKLLRNAIAVYQADTMAYPKALADLAATSAPAQGLDAQGKVVDIGRTEWHGPYLNAVPKDPISGKDYKYDTAAPNVGYVSSSATGQASDGTSYYSSW